MNPWRSTVYCINKQDVAMIEKREVHQYCNIGQVDLLKKIIVPGIRLQDILTELNS